jgi:hypothetical protein
VGKLPFGKEGGGDREQVLGNDYLEGPFEIVGIDAAIHPPELSSVRAHPEGVASVLGASGVEGHGR